MVMITSPSCQLANLENDKQPLSICFPHYLDGTIKAIKELNVAYQVAQIFVLSMDVVWFLRG